jgi:hypothetical protein
MKVLEAGVEAGKITGGSPLPLKIARKIAHLTIGLYNRSNTVKAIIST